MANQVTIDVEARFIDNVSGKTKAASKAFDNLEKEARDAAKEVDKLGKKKAEPKVDANTSPALAKLNKTESKLSKLGNKKTSLLLKATDLASKVIDKVTSKAKALGNKTYSFLVKMRDSNALQSLNKIGNAGQRIAGKTWTAAVKIKDLATSPLRGIKNMLFSIQSIVMAITAGLAAQQLVVKPINLADAYSSAQIGFSTLLGESAGQQMMNDLDAFAKATPFKSSQVISQTQRMLAMGWNAEDIIKDMTTIGDAAAATGKGEQGLQQIVTALAQIKTKGRLSTEELNQLAEAGISAKRYLAEGLGYGTGDEGIAAMTKDLEDGAIASGVALEALLSGMKEYQGMMDKTANETASGLWSQIEDTFEINIFRKWGQGLQDGAKRGFGSVVTLLDQAEGALEEFGDTIYEIGNKVSNWLADKFENAIKRITEITGSFEFKNASLGEKVSMLWNGVIVDPLKEWWEGGGQQKTAETAGKIGTWIGEMLTMGLLAILGATDILDKGIGENQGANIAGSFLQGFLDAFDGSAITQAFADSISNVWGALPTWAKFLIGGIGVGKVAGGISSLAGGALSLIDNIGGILGKTGVAGVKASGILGGLANTGYTLMGGTSALAMGGGTAAMIGAGSIAGGLATAAGLVHAIKTGKEAIQGFKDGNKSKGWANVARSGGTVTGMGAGALLGAKAGTAIGALFGGVGAIPGALIGAGLGTVAGWFAGDKIANNIEAAKFESQEMKDAIKDSEISAEELAQTFEKAKWENAKEHFGDIKLSMSEITRLADQIVWGEDLGNFEKFSVATQAAEANLKSLKAATEETNRWMWKASLGVEFNDDEKESIVASFDEYINSAMSFVENKHYEFTAAVGVLVDLESDGGKSIMESSNAFYASLKEQVEGLGTKLSETVNIALEDGVITLDEQAEITNLQEQIASITSKIANAEQKAELDLIKLKFGNGNLDIDSFDSFMEQIQSTIDERMEANDKAFIASVSSLNLQLEEGAISQEQYDQQLQTIMDGYKSTVEGLRADIKNVELQIVGEAYAQELGNDAVNDLNNALQYAIDNGIDPIEIPSDKLAELLNVGSLPEETASNIAEMLSGTLSHLELLEVDGSLMLRIGEVQTDGEVTDKVQSAVEGTVPDVVDSTTNVNVTGNTSCSLAGNPEGEVKSLVPDVVSKSQTVNITTTPRYMPLAGATALGTKFGLPEITEHTVEVDTYGSQTIKNKLRVTPATFGLPNYLNHTIKVNVTAVLGTVTDNTGLGVFKNITSPENGSGYRGGIFGGPSAMDAFARGGSTDNGGIVGGSTRFIRVNEESPEMIIPLSSQRRERALKLWTKTGDLLGVPGFFRGGRSDGSRDEGIRFNHNESESASGGRDIQVNLGGVNFTIQTSGGDKESIVQAIKEQAGALADYIAGVIADELAGEFENTPTRGGVA